MGYMRNIIKGVRRLTINKSQMVDYIGERVFIDEELIMDVILCEQEYLKEKDIMY